MVAVGVEAAMPMLESKEVLGRMRVEQKCVITRKQIVGKWSSRWLSINRTSAICPEGHTLILISTFRMPYQDYAEQKMIWLQRARFDKLSGRERELYCSWLNRANNKKLSAASSWQKRGSPGFIANHRNLAYESRR
jgi:hypothetical protein